MSTITVTPAYTRNTHAYAAYQAIGHILRRVPPAVSVERTPFWQLLAWSIHGWRPQIAANPFEIVGGQYTIHGLVDLDINTGLPFRQAKPCVTAMGAIAIGVGAEKPEDRNVLGVVILDKVGKVAFSAGELLEQPMTSDVTRLLDEAVANVMPANYRFMYQGRSDLDLTQKINTVLERGVWELR